MTDQGWVKAGELHEGSKVLNSRKEYEVVESIEYKGYNEIEVYNLIVENYHTFFITELGLMVHNIDCKNATLGQIFKQVGDNISDTKIKGDFEDVIKKLDDIAERNNIEEYIKNFDSRFRGLDPNNLDEIKKIISDTSKDIDNHSSSLFKGTEGVSKADKIESLKYTPTSGVKLETTPGKTTTIVGTYADDTQYIVTELGNIKSTDFGPRVDGFNLLNTPDEFYKTPQQFWDEYNKPWLDNVIDRKDVVILATKPTESTLYRINKITGVKELTGFEREYNYLIDHGYIFDIDTMKMKFNR